MSTKIRQQDELISNTLENSEKKVECFGMTFENEEKRREHFTEKLKENLKDQDFRKINGFPIGTDEDILELSDPPYYTACPNPFISEFLNSRIEPNSEDHLSQVPFAVDVSEGKTDPIYRIHTYHTKVPHLAIVRYILHYTKPGDIVFDGFCGSGMTGIAAQLCGDSDTILKIGGNIKSNGDVQNKNGEFMGKIGSRISILNDLSPAATHISAGYNLTKLPENFQQTAIRLMKKFEEDNGWLYQTKDPETDESCEIVYVIWSEEFSCPYCTEEFLFWEVAFDKIAKEFRKTYNCPHCSSEFAKKDLVRCKTHYYDSALGTNRVKQVTKPVEIHYKFRDGMKKKIPDKDDLKLITKSEGLLKNENYPTDLLMFTPEGEKWGDQHGNFHFGITRIHDYHLIRQLLSFSILWDYNKLIASAEARRLWKFTLQSVYPSFTRRNRFRKYSSAQSNNHQSGTMYLSSIVSEPNPKYTLKNKIAKSGSDFPKTTHGTYISTQSLTNISIPDNSIDYIFIDPPFGNNLVYAELNFPWESWNKVFTNKTEESIVSRIQNKSEEDYTELMASCLSEVYRILKPGKWVTIVFHNSKNTIWSSIQEAIGRAKFIIADIRILDKGMPTRNQVYANAVKMDLVISAYKPNENLEKSFELVAGTVEGVWDFVQNHLKKLTVFTLKNDHFEVNLERQKNMLFDRMVAFHIQRGVTVPLSAVEFYSGLEQRFISRDEMYFLTEQAAEYDKKRMSVKKVVNLELFIRNEESAIQWLSIQLEKKPQTFQEIQPLYLRESTGWEKYELVIELIKILEQNFLKYDGNGDVPSQIHSYLSSNFKELRSLSVQRHIIAPVIIV